MRLNYSHDILTSGKIFIKEEFYQKNHFKELQHSCCFMNNHMAIYDKVRLNTYIPLTIFKICTNTDPPPGKGEV